MRKQFGVAIGSFQALQHRAVDMLVADRAGAQHGAVRDDDVRRAATPPNASARDLGGQGADRQRSARFVGQEAIQLHGGIGMTEECQVGHYFRRLTMIEMHVRRHGAPSAAARAGGSD